MVGAPTGTYPGGLGLEDPAAPRVNESGLVYSCMVGPGGCEGVRGDTSVYIGVADVDITNGFQTNIDAVNLNNFFAADIAEGRLFDQARMYACMHT